MTAGARPLVSVAVPLFRSARFVEHITATIDALRYPRLEVIISDRHQADGAIDRLERRYGADRRVRILRGTDGADWVTHYNDLLRAARGTYFCWMPHDDDYPPGYLEPLVNALEARPEALLAFGVMHAADAGGGVPVAPFVPPPIADGEPWSLRVALRWLVFWDLFVVARGLVRREDVVRRGLFLPRIHRTIMSDVCWAFAVAAAGPLVFAPAASCCKHYQASSASAGWHFGVRQAIDECAVMSRTIWRSVHPRREVLIAQAVLAYLAALRVGWRMVRPLTGRPGARGAGAVRSRALRVLGPVLRAPGRPGPGGIPGDG